MDLTIKATELLQLLSKAEKLDLTTQVTEDKDGDYVIRIFELFSPENFDIKVVITQGNEPTYYKGDYNFHYAIEMLDEMLEEKEKERIKAKKRKELIARLSDEEKELLDLN